MARFACFRSSLDSNARLTAPCRHTPTRSGLLRNLRSGSPGVRAVMNDQGLVKYGKHVLSEQETPVADALLKSFLKVQNGTDIRGVVIDGVEGEPVTLTLLATYFIGRAFATWLSRKLERPIQSLRVAVGTDSRLTGMSMRCSFEAGLASKGASIANCGMATTPAMFFSCVASGHMYDGGVMMTASHLPFNRNGVKFFVSEGGLEKVDIRWILEEAATDCGRKALVPGDPRYDPAHVIDAARRVPPSSVVTSNFMDAYIASLRDAIVAGVAHPETPDAPLSGLNILVDAGNGAGGFFATKVLAGLGADITGSQFLEPDGSFPNHVPNPEDAAAMDATAVAVKQNKADLGVVFDTDVDRAGFVDENGRAINRNKLIALMAAITLRQHPGSTVVTDSVTSSGLTTFIENLGGKHLRFKRGYKNVINKGIELNQQGVQCELMIETSGHGALQENRFLDDGAYMSVKVIIEVARRGWEGRGKLSQLLEELEEPAESQEVRLKVQGEEWAPLASSAIESFDTWISEGGAEGWVKEEPNFEGVRVRALRGDGTQSGWVLLRSSLHDPLLVINAESDEEGGVTALLKTLKGFLDSSGVSANLDMAPLQKLL